MLLPAKSGRVADQSPTPGRPRSLSPLTENVFVQIGRSLSFWKQAMAYRLSFLASPASWGSPPDAAPNTTSERGLTIANSKSLVSLSSSDDRGGNHARSRRSSRRILVLGLRLAVGSVLRSGGGSGRSGSDSATRYATSPLAARQRS